MRELLRDHGVEFDTIEYLRDPPDARTLGWLVDHLDSPPAELVRNDKRFAELGLDAGDYTTKRSVVALLLEHPELMQRPIVVRGERAVIARPKERALELL